MIWNLDSLDQVIKNPVRTISHHTDVVLSMSFSADGSLFATTCRDRKIRLIETRSGNLLQVSPCRIRGQLEDGSDNWAQKLKLASATGRYGKAANGL